MARRFEFLTKTHPSDAFAVVSFRGREAMSQPFAFDVRMRAASLSLEAELCGAAAVLRIHAGDGARDIAGIVVAASLEDTLVRGGVFRVKLVPRLWTLGLNRVSRIFQEMSVPDIVEDVLKRHRLDTRWSTSRSYPPREYCVQHLESDLAFVARLCADEGIFYSIDADGDGRDVVVFGDDASAYEAIREPTKVRFDLRDGLERDAETISALTFERRMAAGATEITGFDFRRPTVRLAERASAEVDPDRGLEQYDHEHDWNAFKVSRETATVRLEQHRRRQLAGRGASGCARLQPGRKFTLEDHPREEHNRDHVVTRLVHEGRVPEEAQEGTVVEVYKNELRVIPADRAARPRRPPRRDRQITETATVVGPSGEEIHTDVHGRIKVQFHWHREGKGDDHSSCWIRPMMSWAGAAWGTHFIPRVGMEVVVTFAGGDLDRPLVLGALYNGGNVPPFVLPAKKTQSGIRTRSTPGGEGSNELRFDDAAGAEQIYLHAQRDLVEEVDHDRVRLVRRHENVRVVGTRHVEVLEDHVRHVAGNELVTIDKNFVFHVAGKQNLTIDGGGDDLAPEAPVEIDGRQGAPGAPPAAPGEGPEAAEAALESAVTAATRRKNAELLWLTEQLPDAHHEHGYRLQQAARESGREVTALLLATRSLAALEPEERLERAAGLEEELVTARAAIGAQLDEALRPAPPEMSRLQNALVARLTELDGTAKRGLDAIDRARAGEPPEPAEAILGSVRGGGGADDKFSKEGAASVMTIHGGGTITSNDGFKIVVGGSVIDMKSDSIDIKSAKITLHDGTIELNGSTIKVVGGDVAISGKPIKITSEGDVDVHGKPIKLNC
jgi:type VI secretion system secreted protein VgrG